VTPDAFVDRVEDFDARRFEQWGVRGIALDLDNTIVPWHTSLVTTGARAWIKDVLARGIGICLITNNYSGGSAATSALFNIPIIKGALKPSAIRSSPTCSAESWLACAPCSSSRSAVPNSPRPSSFACSNGRCSPR
jgi:predicted HAD superfamily phosphohydrolase YqeG